MSCLGINSVIFIRVVLNDFSKWKQVIKTEQNSNYSNGKYISIQKLNSDIKIYGVKLKR